MNVLDLLRQDGVQPRKASGNKGGEYHSPCPGCGGEDRFHCWPAQNDGEGSWWCRVCDAGGDAIQYLQDYRGMEFKEAAGFIGRKLTGRARRSRRSLPASEPKQQYRAFEPRQCAEPAERWRAKAGEFVKWAHRRLLQAPAELSYLAGRGLDLEAVKAFRLGINPGDRGRDLYRARQAWGLAREVKANGRDKRLWLPRGIVIPAFRGGDLHRVRIRRPEPRPFGPKYYVVPGSGMAPMLLRPEAKAFVIVEAELDAILCAMNAPEFVGAVGLGSLGARPDEAAHEAMSKSLCILNALDFEHVAPVDTSPEAVEDAARKERQQARLRDWWQETYEQAERWPVPEGKDPGEAYERGVDLRLWLTSGLPPVLTVGTFGAGQCHEGEGCGVERLTETPAAPAAKGGEADSTPPAAVCELATLLHGTDIAFEKCVGGGWSLHYEPKWAMRHWDAFRDILQRMWQPEVEAWLKAHPDSLVGAENILHHGKN